LSAFEERTRKWEESGEAKGKPRNTPVIDTISASDKATRGRNSTWLLYREVIEEAGPQLDVPLEEEDVLEDLPMEDVNQGPAEEPVELGDEDEDAMDIV
jgi:hypothetical protein